jgi:biopolymer transport protein ExbD
MKCLLFVCLGTLAGLSILAASQPPQTPALQKGVSVQMAPSSHASPMPEADNENAWIVTVTRNADIFFGLDKLSPEDLLDKMKQTPRNRDAKLYVKADAAASFSRVQQVLRAARTDLFDDVVLLTLQPEPSRATQIATPDGIEVWISPEPAPNAVMLQMDSSDGLIALKINNESVSPTMLPTKLVEIFDNKPGRIILLNASDKLRYAQIVQAIDACRGAGASRISISLESEI